MIVPERINKKGNVVPAFQIDDKYEWVVTKWKWCLRGPKGEQYLVAITELGSQTPTSLHRFLWKLEYGTLPEWPLQIDHINEDRFDNRISNLRIAGPSLNGRNSSKDRNRGSGLPRGVKHDKRQKFRPYTAQISVNNRKKYLGGFATPEEAHEAYLKAKAELIAEEHNKYNKL